MDTTLRGTVAIVTGASRGIGKQVAIDLGRLGASVVVAARTVTARGGLPGTIGETAALIEAAGGAALAVQADMADEQDLLRLVRTTADAFGRIDVLINNAAATAGKAWGAPLAELTREEWLAQFAVNLHAPFTLIKECVPHMTAGGGGRIVNLTTRTGGEPHTDQVGLPVPLAYPAGKAALDQFCHSVAPELRRAGVSITNLHPGFVRTEMVELLERRGIDAGAAVPLDVPVRAVRHLVTCPDPWQYTGRVLETNDVLS